jgi:putative ABC transport system substrate-binding protein
LTTAAHSAYRPEMDRRRFLLTSLAGALAAPLVAEAQQKGRVYRIGYLHPGAVPPIVPASREAYWSELRGLGFVVGANVIEERRYADGRPDRLPALAAELVRQNVDLIVAFTTSAVKAAQQATTTVPIVMVSAGDPVSDGLIASFSRPGGNVTGTALPAFELNNKVLQLIAELLPNARRLVIVIDPQNATSRRIATYLQKTAQPMGIAVDVAEIRNVEDLERQGETMKSKATDAVWFFTSTVTPTDPAVVQFAVRHRIATVHESRVAVEAGGLMSYGENDRVRLRRVARYVAKILQGARPADLPVELSTYIEVTINLKTAKALGLTIPPSLLLRADHVIE